MKVFIVEDEEMIQQLYDDILTMRGHEVIGKASTGEEAVEMFKGFARKPDLVIMDHRMPGMGGLDAARLIMESDSSTKIILVSADDTAVWESLKLGIVGMKKPFNITDLMSAIEVTVPQKIAMDQKEDGSAHKPTIERSGLYLVEETDGKRGVGIFKELLENGYSGLAFTRKHPEKLRNILGIDEVPLVWFTSTPIKEFTCVSPLNIQKMLIMIQSAMSSSDRSAVLVLGFEYILTNLNFERALNLLQVLNDRVMTMKGSVILFSMDLDIMDTRERKLIKREFEEVR